MKKHWRKIITGVLCLLLFVSTINYAALSAKHEALMKEHEWTMQTLKTQTRLIVELRMKSVPKDFENLDALRDWVINWEKENKPIAISIINRTFVIFGNDELYSQYWDCDDISEAMQRDALKDGYLMSIGLLDSNGCICGVKVSELTYHAGCVAATENAFWFIEPQTGEIAMIARRD